MVGQLIIWWQPSETQLKYGLIEHYMSSGRSSYSDDVADRMRSVAEILESEAW